MKKFVDESWMILLLGVAFAALLAGAQTTLTGRIQENQQRALNQAIAEVVPNTATLEKVAITGYDRDVFKCLDEEGQLAGWAIDAVGMGFADRIRLVVGLTPDASKISGLKVIENIETPGLGNKIADDGWAAQYKGLDPARPIDVKKRPPAAGQNEVQAVTGATISSVATTKAVNEALARVQPELAKQR